MILQGKATNHIWFMEDGEEPHVIGVRLDCGDSGVVYFTREQAADLFKGLSNFLAEAALRAETPTRQWYEYVGKDGRSHWRVTGGNCGCGWTIINDFEWNQYLNREGAERKGQAERAETPAPREASIECPKCGPGCYEAAGEPEQAK